MWIFGDVEMWRFGDVEKGRLFGRGFGDVEMWRCGDAEMWRRGFGKEVEIGKCVCAEYLAFVILEVDGTLCFRHGDFEDVFGLLREFVVDEI